MTGLENQLLALTLVVMAEICLDCTTPITCKADRNYFQETYCKVLLVTEREKACYSRK